jgi:uncharacterized DUF497 family protein
MIGCEWDPHKAARNLIDHKVSFEQAVIACPDPFAIEWITRARIMARSESACSGCIGARCYMLRTRSAETTSG